MPDVFSVLHEDHEEVKAMLARLEAGPKHAGGAVPGQLAQRKQLADELIIENSKHESAEQQYFWPAVRALGPDGERIANEAIEQEVQGEELLNKLDKLNPEEYQQYEGLLTEFASAARAHIAFEEAHAWPLLRASISVDESEKLGARITAAKKTAPTRPHPHTPPTEQAQRTAGPIAGATDRLRDTVSGRGKRR
jgi:hypothetical protein